MPVNKMPDPNRRPAVVDTALADLYGRRQTALLNLSVALDHLHRLLYERQDVQIVRGQRRKEWPTSTQEALDAAKSRLASGQFDPYGARDVPHVLSQIEELRGTLNAIKIEERPLETEYERTRWSRFFMVTSSAGGHIHSDMSCSTCYPTTQYGWLPELSGLTERDAVDAEGPLLCSVCYPSAPTEWTIGVKKEPDPRVCLGSGKPASYQKGVNYCSVCGAWTRATNLGTTRRHFKPTGR